MSRVPVYIHGHCAKADAAFPWNCTGAALGRAASEFLTHGCKMESVRKSLVCAWPRVKILTPRHLCENPQLKDAAHDARSVTRPWRFPHASAEIARQHGVLLSPASFSLPPRLPLK